jgi:hypothetical protein
MWVCGVWVCGVRWVLEIGNRGQNLEWWKWCCCALVRAERVSRCTLYRFQRFPPPKSSKSIPHAPRPSIGHSDGSLVRALVPLRVYGIRHTAVHRTRHTAYGSTPYKAYGIRHRGVYGVCHMSYRNTETQRLCVYASLYSEV